MSSAGAPINTSPRSSFVGTTTASTILSCDALLVPIGRGELLITQLAIEAGTLYRVHGSATSLASEFLQLIAGLESARQTSRPARAGRVIREQVELEPVTLTPIRFQGQPLFSLAPKERARHIGFIWEDPDKSFLGRTVREEFWYQPATFGITPLPSPWGLADYGLYEHCDQQVLTLSGGERHRLSVACVLGLQRKMIVADFGSSNLDADFESDLMIRLEREMSRGTAGVLRGMEARASSAEALWIEVDGGVVSAPTTAVPQEVRDQDAQQQSLAAALTPRTPRDVVLTIDGARTLHAPGVLSCNLREGEIVVVRGRNGVGKTSLGKAIIEKNAVLAAGKIHISQSARPMMALQNAALTLLGRSVRDDAGDETLVDLCGLSDKGGENPAALSRSEQKLLAVAAALGRAGRLAVLDEPTCGIDFESKVRFVKLLNARPHLAVLIFTHDTALDGLGRVLEME